MNTRLPTGRPVRCDLIFVSSPWGDWRDLGVNITLVASVTNHGVLIQPHFSSRPFLSGDFLSGEPASSAAESWTTVGQCGFIGCPGGHPDYTAHEHVRLFNPASVNLGCFPPPTKGL